MAPCVAFGSQRVTEDSATPYSDATQTKKHKPNHVKRPMNAFMVWSQMRRKSSLGSSHHAEISKKLGQEWRTLTDEQKQPFYDEAKNLRKLHSIEYPSYKYQPKKKSDPLRLLTATGRVSKKMKQGRRIISNQPELQGQNTGELKITSLANLASIAQHSAPGYIPESPESLCSSGGLKSSPAWSEISSSGPTSCAGSNSFADFHTQDYESLLEKLTSTVADTRASAMPDGMFRVVDQKHSDALSFHTPPSSPGTSINTVSSPLVSVSQAPTQELFAPSTYLSSLPNHSLDHSFTYNGRVRIDPAFFSQPEIGQNLSNSSNNDLQSSGPAMISCQVTPNSRLIRQDLPPPEILNEGITGRGQTQEQLTLSPEELFFSAITHGQINSLPESHIFPSPKIEAACSFNSQLSNFQSNNFSVDTNVFGSSQSVATNMSPVKVEPTISNSSDLITLPESNFSLDDALDDVLTYLDIPCAQLNSECESDLPPCSFFSDNDVQELLEGVSAFQTTQMNYYDHAFKNNFVDTQCRDPLLASTAYHTQHL
ncbi:transcription factor SOX-10-like [Hyalella azteca]|uniref:Transcription factor SOX-10-like n=1 Tax=Hyalella azteca TaxID=294128 RepID=A0A8B7NG65_HYAAZ|nr:transcription factor SOX-10-like [Hyalella azteca]